MRKQRQKLTVNIWLYLYHRKTKYSWSTISFIWEYCIISAPLHRIIKIKIHIIRISTSKFCPLDSKLKFLSLNSPEIISYSQCSTYYLTVSCWIRKYFIRLLFNSKLVYTSKHFGFISTSLYIPWLLASHVKCVIMSSILLGSLVTTLALLLQPSRRGE